MKKSLLIAVLATLPLSMPLAWANEAHHPDQDKKPAAATPDKEKMMQMGKMQDNMLRMHEQMHKIMQAKDPKERERLKQEHSKMMQDNMHMMRSMKGSGTGQDKMGGGMRDQ